MAAKSIDSEIEVVKSERTILNVGDKPMQECVSALSGDATIALTLAKRTATICTVVGFFALVAVGAVLAADVLLVVFAGVLFAIFLHSLSQVLGRYLRMGDTWSLALAGFVLLLLTALVGAFLLPTLTIQIQWLIERLPESLANLRGRIGETEPGAWLLDRLPEVHQLLPRPQALLSRSTGIATSAIGGVGVLLIVIFLGFMLAGQPSLYQRGALCLVPPANRRRAREVLDEMSSGLKWWLIAKLSAMTVVGVLTWLGLWLLGIDLAVSLAIIAALFTFVPNFGPIISAVPAVLMGLMQGPLTALWVVALFVAIQLGESYVMTPWIQYRATRLAPALVITAQLMVGAWMGVLGLALATPLLVVATVLIRKLYMEDQLHERVPLSDSKEVEG